MRRDLVSVSRGSQGGKKSTSLRRSALRKDVMSEKVVDKTATTEEREHLRGEQCFLT